MRRSTRQARGRRRRSALRRARSLARATEGSSFPIPGYGTVGAPRRVAVAEAAVAHADAAGARRELHHRVVLAWVALARADGDVVATSIAAQQAAELELIARGRLDAGTGADVDVTVAHAASARATVAAAGADREAEAMSAELAGVLGWEPARRLRSEGLPDGGKAEELAALRARIGRHPKHADATQRVIAADATIERVLVERYPLVAVEGQAALDDPTNNNDNDFMVGLALELPVFAHTADRARAARATRAAEQARLASTDAALDGGLVAAYRRWQAADERLHALDRDVVPAQERAAALSAQAYREGARDLASALQAERDLAAVRAEVNAARAEAAGAYADLQAAAGE